MKKFLTVLLLLALAGCAGLAGPRDIELPLPKLQTSLDKRFPLQRRALALFDIAFTNPRLATLPDSGRIALTLDAAVTPPALLRQSWQGTLALSGRLFIDPASNALMMAEPQVDSFSVDGADPQRQQQLRKLANVLIEQLVIDVPLYHFRPDELRYGGVQFAPVRIATTARGVVVSVAPVR